MMTKPIIGAALSLCVALVFVSCSKDKFNDSEGRTMPLTLSTSIKSVKVGLNDDRSSFLWSQGDSFSLFNDKNNIVATVGTDRSSVVVEVPEGTSAVYGFFPSSAEFTGGPGAVRVNIPLNQTQNKAGSLDGHFYPIAGKAAVKDGTATLQLSPVVSALAVNVYRSSGYDASERVQRVTVTPISATGIAGNAELDLTSSCTFTGGDSGKSAVRVFLTESCGVGDGKPSDQKLYKDQIYLTLAKKNITGLKFTVNTNKAEYVAESKNFSFAFSGYDFIVTGFDLSTKEVKVYYESSIQSFERSQAEDDILAGLDNPVLLDIGAQNEDVIPDFSRVGYKYGDEEPPYLSVKKTITVEDVWNNTVAGGGEYADSTAYIQAMIDEVGENGGGAILFKNGTYRVSRTLFIDHNDTVIRGESTDGTVFYGDGKVGWTLFYIGASLSGQTGTNVFEWNGRSLKMSSFVAAYKGVEFGNYNFYYSVPMNPGRVLGASTPIIENYVPLGRLYVEVQNPGLFNVGDDVCVFKPHSNEWISDIGMDKIASNGYTRSVIHNSPVKQWSDRSFARYFSRKVTAILGNRVYLDAPIGQPIDRNYGGGRLCQVASYPRVHGCGIESLTCDSWFDPNLTNNNKPANTSTAVKVYIDENHVWEAIQIKCAEHCWVRNVNDRHIGQSLVNFGAGAKNITVENCHSTEPASYISGNRRYAFLLGNGAELCLIKNCTTDLDRHSFSMSVSEGPHVFYNCVGTRMFDGPEPHQSWCTAGLFDNVTCDNTHLYLRDRGNSGNGHGWAGANFVIWNSSLYSIECSNPWSKENSPEIETLPKGYKFHSDHASGHNWCIGTVGRKKRGTANYKSPYFGIAVDGEQEDYYIDVLGIPYRPDGIWYPERNFDTMGSTADRVNLNNVPAELAAKSWWPLFSGKVETYSNPESLYMSQLEDRHARGIYLNNL